MYDADKKTIVLIHGIGVSSAYYVPLAELLAEHYNVIALDLPGYGKTVKPKHPLTIEELAAVTHGYLQIHDLSDCILIGHSMGCQVIAHLNLMYDKDVEKMILLAPTVNHTERSLPAQTLRLLQDSVYESFRVNKIIFHDYLRMGIPRYLKTAQWMIDDRIEERLDEAIIPTLIVRGTKDHIVTHEWVEYLSTISDLITVKEMADRPHGLHYEYAEEVKEVCEAFIEG